MRGEDALDRAISLGSFPDWFLDSLGHTPDILTTLIEHEEEDTMNKRKNNTVTIDTDLDDSAEFLGTLDSDVEPVELTDSDDTEAEAEQEWNLRLDGAVMSITVHDAVLAFDPYGLPSFIRAIAEKAQYMRVSARRRIDKMQQQTKENLDPASSMGRGRPVSESRGEVEETATYGLEGLTPKQQAFMESLEFQCFQCDLLINDAQRWYEQVDDSDYPLLRRSDAQVLLALIESERKRESAELELTNKRSMQAEAKAKLLARARALG
jgi:hypothetical protein